jgi:hypothetical protein
MNDMTSVIVPKSDQINADDLMAGPLTISITEVEIRPGTEQPVSIHYGGDGGRPWKPCKSMSRVLVAAWGPDARNYVGRSVTLYRDPTVKWGGMEVGGIRVSHLSHIERDMVLALTATKGSRKPHRVRVLEVAVPGKAKAEDKAATVARDLVGRIRSADLDGLKAITGDETVVKQRAWLADKRPELAREVDEAVAAVLAAHEDDPPSAQPAPSDDDGWPGPKTEPAKKGSKP